MFNAVVVTDRNESNRSNAAGPSLAGRNPVYATTIRADPGIVLNISANRTTGSGVPANQQLSFFEKLRTTQDETDHKRSNILAWLYSINIIICPAGIGSYHIFGHPSYASIFIVLQLLGFLACVYHVFCFNLAMHHKRLSHTMSKHVIITIIQVAYVLLGMVLSFMVTRYCIFDIK